MVDLKDKSQPQTSSTRSVHTEDGELAEPGSRPVEGKRKRHHSSEKHHETIRHRLSRFMWDFKFELLALVFLGGGMFLLLAPFKITPWALGLISQAFHYVHHIVSWVVGWIFSFEKSDIGGAVLLVGAVVLVGLDIRTRILRRHEHFGSEPLCSCGSQMRRVRSTLLQQVFAWVFRVRVKRFFCSKCGRRMALWRSPHESDW